MSTEPVEPRQSILFGEDFALDLRPRRLRHGNRVLKLERIPLEILLLLLERPGEIVGREELRQALWPEGVFVEFDQGISSAIRRLREALADSADNPIFIETVERRGYRWIAPIHPPEPDPEEKSGLGEKEEETFSSRSSSKRLFSPGDRERFRYG